jgi:ribose transport system substrate-binding protein
LSYFLILFHSKETVHPSGLTHDKKEKLQMKTRGLMKMMLGLMILLIPIGSLACSGSPKQKTKEDVTFVFVDPVVGDPYWVEVDQGCRDAAKKLGVKVNIVGPSKVDANEQINYLETAMAQKVDGIVTMALNPPAFIPVINKAIDQGIPVMLLDGDAPESKRLAFFGTNAYESGITAGKLIEKLTNGKAKVGIITAGIDIQQINERIQGIKDYFKDKPSMTVVAIEDSRADEIIATEKATTLLQANPEINLLFAGGAVDTPGVGKAVEELHLVGKVIVVGMNDTPQALDYVRSGVIQAVLAEKPYAMCYMAIEALKKTVLDKQPVTGVVNTGVTIVTKENIDTYKTGN